MSNTRHLLPLLLLGGLPAVAVPTARAGLDNVPVVSRGCSIAKQEVVKIAAWDFDRAFDRIAPAQEALAEVAAIVGMINPDVLALQGVSDGGQEVTVALQILKERGRCYHALESAGGFATVFDPDVVDLGYAEGVTVDCDGKPLKSSASPKQPARSRIAQLAHFKVKPYPPVRQTFTFAILNADVGTPEGLPALAERYNRLGRDHPELSQELDLIVIGDLAVDPARLTRDYFPNSKPLINMLLKINSGLSNKTFDQAVAASRAPGGESDPYNDNILVRRWDQPGTCPGSGYCGGLEEFINARIYRTDSAGGRSLPHIAGLVHPPVAARFCKFADSDPGEVEP